MMPGRSLLREHQRALERAGGQHDLPRAHLPQPLARQMRRRGGEMVGDALGQPDHVVREIAESGGARQQRDARIAARVPQACRRATPARAGRRSSAVVSASSEPPSSACSSHRMTRAPASAATSAAARPGRPGADDQHVAMGEAAGVAVRVGQRRRPAQARGGADRRLVEFLPRPGRPLEGLVVEAGRQQRRQRVVDDAHIEARATASGSGSRRCRPSYSSTCVARRFGAVRALSRATVTSAFGSSEPADRMPRGRWYLNERPTRCTPLASSAEASVSPAKP